MLSVKPLPKVMTIQYTHIYVRMKTMNNYLCEIPIKMNRFELRYKDIFVMAEVRTFSLFFQTDFTQGMIRRNFSDLCVIVV